MNESLHALSGAYVVDALDDDEREIFEEHLPGCLDCQAEVASLREATALLADDAALTPPPRLRDAVLSGISTVRPLPPVTTHTTQIAQGDQTQQVAKVVPLRHRRRFRLGSLAAAAAILAVVGAGAVIQPWEDNTSSTLSVADQVLAASDATHVSMNFDDGSSATVVRSKSEGHAVLLTRKMAAPPSDKAYELWLRDENGRMNPAGLMTTAGDHKVVLKGDSNAADAVGITVEPEGGSAQPTTEPIAMFDLGKAEA